MCIHSGLAICQQFFTLRAFVSAPHLRIASRDFHPSSRLRGCNSSLAPEPGPGSDRAAGLEAGANLAFSAGVGVISPAAAPWQDLTRNPIYYGGCVMTPEVVWGRGCSHQEGRAGSGGSPPGWTAGGGIHFPRIGFHVAAGVRLPRRETGEFESGMDHPFDVSLASVIRHWPFPV